MITPVEVLDACEKNNIKIKLADTVDIARALNNDIDFLNYIHEEIILKVVEHLNK